RHKKGQTRAVNKAPPGLARGGLREGAIKKVLPAYDMRAGPSFLQSEKFLLVAQHKNGQDNEGQDKGKVKPQFGGEPDTLTLIGLQQEVLIAPGVFLGDHAEQQVENGA